MRGATGGGKLEVPPKGPVKPGHIEGPFKRLQGSLQDPMDIKVPPHSTSPSPNSKRPTLANPVVVELAQP